MFCLQSVQRFLQTRKILSEEGNEFKRMLHDSYQFVDGMDTLLQELNMKGYEVHALSNYSEWYQIIEKRHRLSQYGLKWSFVSCNSGKNQSLHFYRIVSYIIQAYENQIHNHI
jgi:hypothetical protein